MYSSIFLATCRLPASAARLVKFSLFVKFKRQKLAPLLPASPRFGWTTGLGLPFTRTTVQTIPFGTDVLQIEKQTGLIYNLFAPFDHATVVSQLSRPIMSITQWGDGSLGGQSLKFTFQPTCGERHGRRLLVHLILCFLWPSFYKPTQKGHAQGLKWTCAARPREQMAIKKIKCNHGLQHRTVVGILLITRGMA